jgi:hypothetical protein
LAEQNTTLKKEEKIASREQITTTRGNKNLGHGTNKDGNKNLIGRTNHYSEEGRKISIHGTNHDYKREQKFRTWNK